MRQGRLDGKSGEMGNTDRTHIDSRPIGFASADERRGICWIHSGSAYGES